MERRQPFDENFLRIYTLLNFVRTLTEH